MENRLYYGDNLEILRSREYFPDECVDLIYLDPPFNSNRDHNVLFQSESGADSEAQITAFEDTWHWGETAEQTYRDLIIDAPAKVSMAIEALLNLIDRNQMMAYLVMMAARLVELDRVLKQTGSLYLHCDPTASHYLKILLDAIFDARNFKNELIWKRTSAHSDANRFGKIHDVILFYSKSEQPTWNNIYQPYDEAYVNQYYRYQDDDGRRWMSGDLSASGLSGGGYEYEWKGVVRVWRCPIETMRQLENENRIYYTLNGIARIKRYLDESKGQLTNDLWTDIEALRSWHKEQLGYPTQKPVALVERAILASSNEGDVVLDPFCGCGTSIAAAHKLKRNWIGIDITHLSIALQKYRLGDMFELASGRDYAVIGEPTTEAGARELALDSANEGRYQFEWWALSLAGAKPVGGKAGSRRGKKGADKGIDASSIFSRQDEKGKTKSAQNNRSSQIRQGKRHGCPRVEVYNRERESGDWLAYHIGIAHAEHDQRSAGSRLLRIGLLAAPLPPIANCDCWRSAWRRLAGYAAAARIASQGGALQPCERGCGRQVAAGSPVTISRRSVLAKAEKAANAE